MAYGIHRGSGVRKHLNGQRREAVTLTGCSAIQPKSKTIVKFDGPCSVGVICETPNICFLFIICLGMTSIKNPSSFYY